ncbi:MAG: hypothetical protein M2R45_01760 [Verrucomicrobia subdivision 3 bacterium]|nr:hypothetical protein [Limisphaerales bacterium]MCS1413497.1 hypothetical protein [Limisphaerales bacterium]
MGTTAKVITGAFRQKTEASSRANFDFFQSRQAGGEAVKKGRSPYGYRWGIGGVAYG